MRPITTKTLTIVCATLICSMSLHAEPDDKALIWKAVDGRSLGEDFTALSKDAKSRAGSLLKKKDGSKTTSARVLEPNLFFSDRSFYAQLPQSVRKTPEYIRFLLHGVAKEDPELGTILNIDGAIMGYRVLEGSSGKVAEVMAVTGFKHGRRVWTAVGMSMPIDVQSTLTGSPPLGVKLDHEKNTWAICIQDIILKENMPLYPENGPPVVKIRAGAEHGDMAILADIAVKGPNELRDRNVPVVDGKVDLAAAVAAGTPGVWRGEAPKGK